MPASQLRWEAGNTIITQLLNLDDSVFFVAYFYTAKFEFSFYTIYCGVKVENVCFRFVRNLYPILY